MFYHGKIQQELNTPNSRANIRTKKGSVPYYPNPSRPGEPPHKITGFGAANVKYELEEEELKTRVGLTVNALYMLFLELGVKGGAIIRPKSAKMLRFVAGGAVHFARSVRQGRILARPWLVATLKKYWEQIRAYFLMGMRG